MMSVHLVCTSLEEGFENNKKNLLLGKWCERFDQTSFTKQYEITFSLPHNPPIEIKKQEMFFLLNLTDKLLCELTLELNKVHEVNFNKRYWEIIIGYWLHRYVRIMYNRYKVLSIAFESWPIKSFTYFESNSKLLTYDLSRFIHACNEDDWNQMLWQEMILLSFATQYELERVSVRKDFKKFDDELVISRPSVTSQVKRFLRKCFISSSSVFISNKDAFFHTTYFTKWIDIKLSLMLKQCPQFWLSPEVPNLKFNSQMRENFKLDSESVNGFERVVRQMICQMLPLTYLEGYKKINSLVQKTNWPKNPMFIFTSNSFDTDEVFKFYTATQVSRGVKYITGQHGNNYGTHFYAGVSTWPERSASDFFISWGWKDDSSHVVQGFNFKVNNRLYRKYDCFGKLLLIENSLPHMITPWDVYEDFEIYQNEQFEFVGNLSTKIQSEVMIRLHGNFKSLKWFEDLRWKQKFPNLKIETGMSTITELISKSRLVVHSYDSTGILETLTLNIPTICFWNGNFEHLLDNVKEDYQKLKEANIFFENPIKCAEFIENNWNSIEEWWNSEFVQNTRISFCSKYSKLEKRPAQKLCSIFKSLINK